MIGNTLAYGIHYNAADLAMWTAVSPSCVWINELLHFKAIFPYSDWPNGFSLELDDVQSTVIVRRSHCEAAIRFVH